MRNFFTSEDFGGDFGNHHTTIKDAVGVADIANAKLNKLIESWPVVYGFGETAGASSLWNMNGPSKERVVHTHTARLAFIEELPKEPCKHEPDIILGKDGIRVSWPVPFAENITQEIFVKIKCKHCGVELVATWSEKSK